MMKPTHGPQLKRFEGSHAMHRYSFLAIGIVAAVAHLVSFFVLSDFFSDPLRRMTLPSVLYFILPLLALTFFVLYNVNLHPTIWTGDEGLYVSFNFGRVFIPWKDVIGIREKELFVWYPRLYARKITWFHYIYAISNWSFTPTIPIDPMMNHALYDELLDEIEAHVPDPYL
jgi:hypothetical protein